MYIVFFVIASFVVFRLHCIIIVKRVNPYRFELIVSRCLPDLKKHKCKCRDQAEVFVNQKIRYFIM